MKKRIFALLAAASMTFAAGCEKKEDKIVNEPPVPIIEQEITAEAENTTIPPDEVAEFPDYPVDIPNIEHQDTGYYYEAENADISEQLKVENEKDNFSGRGYVTGFVSGAGLSVPFKVNIPSNQHYDLIFNIASDKESDCNVLLNGRKITSFKTASNGKFTLITIPGVFLTKGKSTISLNPEGGSVCLDYLKLSDDKLLSGIKYNADGTLSNENAGGAAKKLMSFISESYGKYIITGQYAADDDNSELDLIYKTTGKYPVIRFCDLSVSKGDYDASFKYIDAIDKWYRNGGISCVSWYWNSPSEKSSVKADETDFKLKNAVTDKELALLSQEEIRGLYGEGNISEECYSLVLDIDSMAGQLASLKNKGVPILWRPLPEGGGSWYWWGADGSKSYKWLYDLIYKRMTEYFGLDNLVWIWNGQTADTLVDSSKYDIAAVDLYFDAERDYGSRFSQSFAAIRKISGSGKPVAISECGSVPDIDVAFRDNTVWSFFGLWFGEYVETPEGEYSEEYTSKNVLARTYNSEGALTLDEYKKLCEANETE